MLRALAILLVSSGCSLLVEFDPEGRPCGPGKRCLDGYSCMVHTCVKDFSVEEGQTCYLSQNCKRGLVCTVPSFICRNDCERPFGNHTECPENQVCASVETPEGDDVAACVASDCDPDDAGACQVAGEAPQTCIGVTTDSDGTADDGLCKKSCSITCVSGDCRGTCPPETPALSCQPLGPDNTFGCLEEGTGIQGDCCDQITRRCDRFHACVRSATGDDGTCLEYCDDSLDCPNGETCNVHGEPPNTFQACGDPLATPSDCGGPAGGDTDGPPGGDTDTPPAGPSCQEECTDSPDCLDDFACENNRCVYQKAGCTDAEGCWISNNFFLGSCAASSECFSGAGVCVSLGGGGYCVFEDTDGCTDPTPVGVTLDRVEGGTVVTCVYEARDSYQCRSDGTCGCATDTYCDSYTNGKQPICDVPTGYCECASTQDCQSDGSAHVCYDGVCGCGSNTDCTNTWYPHCNLTTGWCDCQSDDECRTNGRESTLFVCGADGGCYCSSASDCTGGTTSHDGTTWVCEP
jgi:hypothetical protein